MAINIRDNSSNNFVYGTLLILRKLRRIQRCKVLDSKKYGISTESSCVDKKEKKFQGLAGHLPSHVVKKGKKDIITHK